MRLIALLPLVLTAPLLHAAPPAPARPLASVKATACQETDRMYDWREITCTVPAAAATRRFQFKAMFTGGHDDTSASIAPTLGEAPLACAEGSKLSLFGEDGDVHVFCDFGGAAMAGRTTFKVLIKWSHAEFADFDFLAD